MLQREHAGSTGEEHQLSPAVSQQPLVGELWSQDRTDTGIFHAESIPKEDVPAAPCWSAKWDHFGFT